MNRITGAVAALAVVVAFGAPARADDTDAAAVLDKAIKAVGGEEKLGKIKGASWKTKGTISVMGNDAAFTAETTFHDFDHQFNKFEGEFGGMKLAIVNVIAGDKGWRKIGDAATELDKDALANAKRMAYISQSTVKLTELKGKGFKLATAGEEKVSDKPATVLKVTGPDGKDFTLAFDKESGLPVRLVAKVKGLMGEEFTQETTFSDYKEMGGIQKATKVVSKRDGEKFQDTTVSEFKILDKVDPKLFEEPK